MKTTSVQLTKVSVIFKVTALVQVKFPLEGCDFLTLWYKKWHHHSNPGTCKNTNSCSEKTVNQYFIVTSQHRRVTRKRTSCLTIKFNITAYFVRKKKSALETLMLLIISNFKVSRKLSKISKTSTLRPFGPFVFIAYIIILLDLLKSCHDLIQVIKIF